MLWHVHIKWRAGDLSSEGWGNPIKWGWTVSTCPTCSFHLEKIIFSLNIKGFTIDADINSEIFLLGFFGGENSVIIFMGVISINFSPWKILSEIAYREGSNNLNYMTVLTDFFNIMNGGGGLSCQLFNIATPPPLTKMINTRLLMVKNILIEVFKKRKPPWWNYVCSPICWIRGGDSTGKLWAALGIGGGGGIHTFLNSVAVSMNYFVRP